MKTKFLFPYWCKYMGVLFFCAHIPFVIFRDSIKFPVTVDDGNIFGSYHVFFMITTLLMLTGLVLFAFSKERIEDEQIAQLRMDSLQWAVYLSYILLIVCLAVFSKKQDIKDVMHMGIWVPLLIFIVLFRWKMFRNSRYTKEDAI